MTIGCVEVDRSISQAFISLNIDSFDKLIRSMYQPAHQNSLNNFLLSP